MKDSLFAKIRLVVKQEQNIRKEMPQLAKLFFLMLFVSVPHEIFLVLRVYPLILITNGFLAGASKTQLYWAVAEGLAIGLSSLALQHLMGTIRHRFIENFRAVLKGDAQAKEMSLSADWHVAHGTGEKEAIIATNVVKVLNLLDAALFDAVPVALRALCRTIALLWFGAVFSGYAFAAVVFYIVTMYVLEPRLKVMRKDHHNDNRYLDQRGTELTMMWNEVQSHGLELEMAQRYREDHAWARERERTRHLTWRSHVIFLDLVVTLFSVGLFALLIHLYGGLDVKRAVSAVAMIIVVYPLFDGVTSNLFRFNELQHHLNRGMEALRELVEIFLIQPTVQQDPNPIWPENLEGSIEFRNVSFKYPGTDRWILRNINLVIPAGQSVALIGHTGSGKTTLAQLVNRRYDPTEGEILIGGVPLRKLDFYRYRQEIVATVNQKSSLFLGSVRYNIRVAADRFAPQGQEEWAARLAQAEKFILKLPAGYETKLGEDGADLSGGERQRISIARVVAKKAKINIMDEATSALDEDSQKAVQDAIDQLISEHGQTSLVIAHRLTTIDGADRILVLDNGFLVEDGSHAELMEKKARYYQFRNPNRKGSNENRTNTKHQTSQLYVGQAC